jgi:sugar lactone lactonase YvrE
MARPRTLLAGLAMGESPRWHDGRLWYSDMGAREVGAVDLQGRHEVVVTVPDGLTGIGFLPDGRLLLDTTFGGTVLRLEADGSLARHAVLTAIADPPWSDMIVDGRGNTYVGNLGFNFPGGEPFAPGSLVLVEPDGSARQVADDLAFPNGIAVTPDNATLIVAESYAARLTAFDIAPDGSLSNRRSWAEVPGSYPDGICIDADGAIWFAEVPGRRCVRVREGGRVLDTIDLDLACFACTLGGPDGRTLFLMVADWSGVATTMGGETRSGEVLMTEAPARGVGWP